MNSIFVPDASVAVKWLIVEPDSSAAAALLHTDHEICAPALLRIEVAAAIVRRFRTGHIAEIEARERLAHSQRILAENRVRYIADIDLLPQAGEIALRIKHNLQDCLYIACAQRLGARVVTTDKTLLKRATPHFSFVQALP